MENKTKRYFDLATPDDAKQLLEILEEEPFPGSISLLYTRRPDPYRSFQCEGDRVDVIVYRDAEENRIIGFGVCAVRKVFFDGVVRNVGYLFGMRSRPDYRGRLPISKSYKFIRDLYEPGEVDYFITTILEDNVEARRLLEPNRRSIPNYDHISDYGVFAFNRFSNRKRQQDISLHKSDENSINEVVRFINDYGKDYQFYPYLDVCGIIERRIPGLSVSDFYYVTDRSGGILAAGAAWDQSAYKQYIVSGYSGVLKLIYPLSGLLPLVGLPKLPPLNEMFKFYTLSFWAIRDNDEDIFAYLTNGITKDKADYPFFLIGVASKHPLYDFVSAKPNISYRSQVYLVDWSKNNVSKNSLDEKYTTYFECGTL